MSNWTETEVGTLRRLIKKAEQDPEFSSEDIEALKQILDAFKGLRAFGRFAKWVVFMLAAVAGGVTAWETITSKARTWFGS